MNTLEFTLVVLGGSLMAGLVGSLTGMGGGVVVVPLLTLGLGVDFRYAAGASLVSVIATSSGAAAAYVKEGYTNIRLGMFLEIATASGALVGAFIATRTGGHFLEVVFGVVLLLSAYMSNREHPAHPQNSHGGLLARGLRMSGTYPAPDGPKAYSVRRIPLGFLLMLVAGCVSGLLGIGSGAFKVLAMDQAMGLPFKVSTTTSNFMIGVTAAASAGLYLSRGYIDPGIAMPVVLGVLGGSFAGSRFLARADVRALRVIFTVVILVLAVEMILHGITGWF